jgi:hypothetical protein
MNRLSCRTLVIVFTLCIIFPSCGIKKKNVRLSFYYWRTNISFSDDERNALQKCSARKLYLRFFDIEPDRARRKAIPVGIVGGGDTLLKKMHVIPVVFIQNAVFQTATPWITDSLPQKTVDQISSISHRLQSNVAEIQFDCDWTERTRKAYFDFLRGVRKEVNGRCRLSATIRLHQVKYKKRMEVPPVDRGMVMVYNLVCPSADTLCSIYDHSVAMKYLPYLNDYPLQCDIALPIFSWGIQTREGRVIDINHTLTMAAMLHRPGFEETGKGYYRALESQFAVGGFVQKDDIIKVEEANGDRCKDAFRSSIRFIDQDSLSLALFCLDSTNLQRIDVHEIEKLCDSVH